MTIELVDRLMACALTGGVRLADVIGSCAQRLVIESDRLYTPLWDEAFVDLNAIIAPEAYRKLLAVPKWAFEEAKPCAFAVASTEGGIILASSGLLGLIGFCAYHSGAASVMAARGADEDKLREFEDMFLHIVTNHVVHGWPLPGRLEVSSALAYQKIVIHRDCMTAFVLLHELGHIDLGHLGGRDIGPIDFQPRIPDLPSQLHAAEIEADDFACSAFANPDALDVAATLLTAWANVEAGRRLIRGPSAHLSLTHPLSINRLDRLARRLSQRTDGASTPSCGAGIMVGRTAAIVENPSGVGLQAQLSTREEGLARQRTLLEGHRRIAQSAC